MRVRTLTALLAALLLVVAACTDEEGEEGAAEEGAEEELDELSEEDLAERQPEMPEPEDLEDGTAALVNDREIASSTVDERFEAVLESPEVAEMPEEETEGLADNLRAQILTQMVLEEVIADGAEELGAEPSEDDVEEAKAAAAEQAGGEEALEEQLAAQGLTTDDERDEVFLLQARVDRITEVLSEDLDEDEVSDEQAEELGMDPGQLALQEWLMSQTMEADVRVDGEYGVWSPEAGQVVPASA